MKDFKYPFSAQLRLHYRARLLKLIPKLDKEERKLNNLSYLHSQKCMYKLCLTDAHKTIICNLLFDEVGFKGPKTNKYPIGCRIGGS